MGRHQRCPGNAIRIRDAGNIIAGNYIGTDRLGTLKRPGNLVGIRIEGTASERQR